MADFLAAYLTELSEGNKFYDGCKTVIEGTDIDFERLIPRIDRSKYLLIGLTYDAVSKEELFAAVRKYDTEDDWTYYLSDEQLAAYCAAFVEKNKFFKQKFEVYDIPSFDTGADREAVLTQLVEDLEQMAELDLSENRNRRK